MDEQQLSQSEQMKTMCELLEVTLMDISDMLDAEDEQGRNKNVCEHETHAASTIAQLNRVDEIIYSQLHLIQHQFDELTQMRTALMAELGCHKQLRNELLSCPKFWVVTLLRGDRNPSRQEFLE